MSDNRIAFIFPGQGSQFVGMGKEFIENDEKARELMSVAGELSGYPIEKLCLEGPMEELTRTAHLQPAGAGARMSHWRGKCRRRYDVVLRYIRVKGEVCLAGSVARSREESESNVC